MLLDVRELKVHFERQDGIVKAVDGVSYNLELGECVGVVGESGSGKTVSVLSMLRLLPSTAHVSGKVFFNGRNIFEMNSTEMQRLRGQEISMIFQDPMTALNPTIPVGRQIMEPLLWHNMMTLTDAKRRALELLEQVGIPEPEKRFGEYPHQFSGGMCQRVVVATALACRPEIVIADEPTTALDVTIQAQILQLLQDMRREYQMGLILITHDFSVAATICDRLVVMYAGNVMEIGPVRVLLSEPLHPYTQGLLRATPAVGRRHEPLESIPGVPPDLIAIPPGCRFYPRCPKATERCSQETPELVAQGGGHWVSCWTANGSGGKNQA